MTIRARDNSGHQQHQQWKCFDSYCAPTSSDIIANVSHLIFSHADTAKRYLVSLTAIQARQNPGGIIQFVHVFWQFPCSSPSGSN
jgi:hypothetical protein